MFDFLNSNGVHVTLGEANFLEIKSRTSYVSQRRACTCACTTDIMYMDWLEIASKGAYLDHSFETL